MHSGETVKIRRRGNKMIKKIANITMSILMFFSGFTFLGCQKTEGNEELSSGLPEYSDIERERWEFEFAGLLGRNTQWPHDWYDVSHILEDYPKGIINLKDYREGPLQVITISGVYETFSGKEMSFHYRPWFNVYYYNDRGEKEGPYFGGVYNVHRYKLGDENTSYEEVNQAKWSDWSSSRLGNYGWHQISIAVYNTKEEYIEIRQNGESGIRNSIMDFYVKVRNQEIYE
ncbi:MAG: hypothetical protein IJX87_06165 [Clostridia bacterium]|nr:hypothetical protein [Clostridia bacterium]